MKRAGSVIERNRANIEAPVPESYWALPAVLVEMETSKPLKDLFASLNRSHCRSLGNHTYSASR